MTAVDDALDLHLDDGRIVHLPGIAVSKASAEARRGLSAWLIHTPVAVAPLQGEADRWGRVVALVFAPPPDDPQRPVSVIEALLDAGQALARPSPALEPCWATMLRLERGAERDTHGLWRVSPVLGPDDRAGLQAQAGSFALVAGRVSAVRQGRARLYIRFAQDGGTGMAATLSRSLVKRLDNAGTGLQAWVGRRLRIRGLLDDRWGWQIEATTPQQLEFDVP